MKELKDWQKNVLDKALYHDLISNSQFNKAVKIIENFTDRDTFYHKCIHSKDELCRNLANAVQV